MTTKPEDLIVWLRQWASPERAHGDATYPAQAADLIEKLLAENASI